MSYYSQSSGQREEQFRQSSQQRRMQQMQRQTERNRETQRQQSQTDYTQQSSAQTTDEQRNRARQLQQYQNQQQGRQYQQVPVQQGQQYQRQTQAQQTRMYRQQAQEPQQLRQVQARPQQTQRQQAQPQSAPQQPQRQQQVQRTQPQSAPQQPQRQQQVQRTQPQSAPQQPQRQQQVQRTQTQSAPQQPQQYRQHRPQQQNNTQKRKSARRPEAKGSQSVLANIRDNYLRMYRSQKWKISSLLLFPIAIVYYELLLRLYSGSSFFSNLGYPILFALAVGVLISAITSALPKKISRNVNLVLLYLLSLVFTVACLVYANYKVYMSVGSIFSGAGNITGQYKSELFLTIFKGIPTIFLYFFPALFYTFTGKRRVPAQRFPVVFSGALLVLSLCLFGISALAGSNGDTGIIYNGGSFDTRTHTFGLLMSMRLDMTSKGSSTDFIVTDEQTVTMQEDETAAEDTSALEASEASAEEIAEEDIDYGVNEMDIDFDSIIASGDDTAATISEYVETLTPSNKNKYTGLFEGKNLILITAEAFSGAVVNEELTPTLYRMIHNGFYFSDFYQPAWGGSTSSGEFSVLFGIAPEQGAKTVLNTAENNNYFTMGNQLQRLDYYSAAFHNGVYDTYNRDQTHTNLGYASWTAMSNGLEDLTDWDNSDTVMFDKTLDTYIDMQPFSVYYMTLSGHCPYRSTSKYVEKYYDKVKAYYGDQYKDTTLYYLCYQQELEEAMTLLVERLEEAGIADDTVICMTGDHYPYGLQKASAFQTDQDYLIDFYGADYNDYDWNRDRNSAILWCESLENEDQDFACEISEPTFSLDLLPTLSNLFGVEYDSRLLVGRDVFSDEEAIVFWNSCSWATKYGRYDYASKTFFPYEGGEQYADDQNYIDRITNIVANKIHYSASVTTYDYWGTLFGTDDVTENPSWVAERQAELENAAAADAAASDTADTAAATDGTEAAEQTAEDGTDNTEENTA